VTEDLPPTRSLIAEYKLQASKSLGQNFITDHNILDKIVRLSGLSPGENVVEIGAGPGGLTRALLRAGAGQVIAIEPDPRTLPLLERIVAHYPDRMHLILKHAEDVEVDKLPTPAKIVANLPYNVASLLLVQWLEAKPRWWSDMTLLFQKEVASRLAAPVGSAAYGRLSILTQALCSVEILWTLPPDAFVPKPKVKSSLVKLTPLPDRSTIDVKKLGHITAQAFSKRRKMLRTTLKDLLGDLEDLGIDPKLRAQNLSVETYIALSQRL